MLYEEFYSKIEPELAEVKKPMLPPKSGKDDFDRNYMDMESQFNGK